MDRDEVDITRYDDLAAKAPAADWIVNCAAFTQVDLAETEREAAHAVNAVGAGNAARLCAARGARLLHLSTDYVFDGALSRPYREDDPTGPLNYYGTTKLLGEQAIEAAGASHLIVRTQSLFGPNGRNFVQAILRRLREGNAPVRVVNDQISAPTYTKHLAQAILRLLHSSHTGTVHVSASGHCSWYEFACAIAERAGAAGRVVPIPSADYPVPAKRPAFSVLDNRRFSEWTGWTMPGWQDGLTDYLRETAETPRSGAP